MTIGDKITAQFESQEFIPEIYDSKAFFQYPCPKSYECSPITVLIQRGKYRFELWGAQGGDARQLNSLTPNENSGGKGAYVAGSISIFHPQFLHLYIGGKGEDQVEYDNTTYSKGGFNGGGKGGNELKPYEVDPESSAGGGGATDIRLLQGQSIEDLKSRIIVAAGGGGACSTGGANGNYHDYRGGHGGTINGITFNLISTAPSQTTESFGKGIDGMSFALLGNQNGGSTGGGGSGYYGGSHITIDDPINYQNDVEVGGAGGSSFVSGCSLCNAVLRKPIGKVEHSGKSTHYSGMKFSEIEMYAGNEKFFKPMSSEKEEGHSGNGAIVITYIGPINQETYLIYHLLPAPFLCLLFITITK